MKNILKKKKELIIGLIFLVVIILCIVFIVSNGNSKENKKEDKKDDKVVVDPGHKIEEKDIVDAYGMSKDDAIKIVKKLFNSDNFDFSAEINSDSKYVVTVKNTVSDTEYKYLVDPISKSYYEMN